ncbi:hypothetical protein [Roseateles sp.]|uniref:hypothetical protein n=1 Tax=Roseateles sp. TaxID=1971397 RepID=UPI003BA4F118
MLKKMSLGLSLAAALLLPTWALASGDHAGDIAVSAQNGKLMVGGAHFETHGVTGFNIYEADFGDLASGPWATKDPGFQTQGSDLLKPGALISFEGVGKLSFWNGSAWNVAQAGVGVSVADVYQDALTTWNASGVTPGETAYVSEVSLSGTIHDHLKMSVTPNAAVGAYMIEMKLTSADYTSSDSFYIVFNRGLADAAFESSVEALVTAPVPELGTYALMFAGLLGVGLMVRRRQQ